MTDRLNELLSKNKTYDEQEVKMMKDKMHDGCITISRIINSPRERVWERWTDPEQFMCWWGPKDFTSPYAKLDPRVGGKYLTCMRGPDGKDYWDTGTYEEIQRLERIVYSNTFSDEQGNAVPASYYGMGSDKIIDMEVAITLEDTGGKTRLTLEHCGLPDGEMLDQSREGWNQSLDKLENCLR